MTDNESLNILCIQRDLLAVILSYEGKASAAELVMASDLFFANQIACAFGSGKDADSPKTIMTNTSRTLEYTINKRLAKNNETFRVKVNIELVEGTV